MAPSAYSHLTSAKSLLSPSMLCHLQAAAAIGNDACHVTIAEASHKVVSCVVSPPSPSPHQQREWYSTPAGLGSRAFDTAATRLTGFSQCDTAGTTLRQALSYYSWMACYSVAWVAVPGASPGRLAGQFQLVSSGIKFGGWLLCSSVAAGRAAVLRLMSESSGGRTWTLFPVQTCVPIRQETRVF